jgi:hypothetical protein
VIVALCVLILRKPPWTITVLDGLYWTAVFGMVVARYVDVSRFTGRTLTGEPATQRDVKRYALGLLSSSGLLWAIAQTFQI